MDGEDEVGSLSELAKRTLQKFNRIIQLPDTAWPTSIPTQSQPLVRDAFERFQLWVGSIGAAVAPHRKVSLDWRLRDAQELKEQIGELQLDLIEALDDFYALISGKENRIKGEETFELDSDDTITTAQGVNEAQDVLEVVQECVRSLLRLSILIRKSTPRSRWDRALQKSREPINEQYDIRHVADKYPKLRAPEQAWLLSRLGRAITQRRQFIRYCRDHKNELSSVADSSIDRDVGFETAEGSAPAETVQQPLSVARSDVMTVEERRTQVSTQASTLQLEMLQPIRGDDDDGDDTNSVVSSVVSTDEAGDEDKLRLPTLQTVSGGREEFECPICFTMQSFRRERNWK